MSATKPKPPPASLDTTWPVMQECLDLYMAGYPAEVPPAKYMEAYTAVYNYCTASRVTRRPDPSRDDNVPDSCLIGRDLYDEIKNYFTAHLDALHTKLKQIEKSDLLSVYVTEWNRYQIGAENANRCFNYFNRHWVDRERSEGKIRFHRIYNLALLLWRDKIFYSEQQHGRHVVTALLKMIDGGRNGEQFNTELAKNFVDSSIALGVNETDEAKTGLELYQEEFEGPFLEATKEHFNENYAKLSEDLKIQGAEKNQLPKAEASILLCLPPSTHKKVLETWESVVAHHQGDSA